MDLGAFAHNEDCPKEGSMNCLPFTGLPDVDSSYEEPSVSPRVGEEYQAKIPPLLSELENVKHMDSMFTSGNVLSSGYSANFGLSIPIVWVNRVGQSFKLEQGGGLSDVATAAGHMSVDSGQSEEVGFTVSRYHGLSESPHAGLVAHQNHPQTSACEHHFPDNDWATQICPCLDGCKDVMHIPLPDSPAVSWTDEEKESFLLGLYIFGKDLVLVRNFVESKDMDSILSYYYGGFYRSDAYCRWSECRKPRSRKYTYGQRLFTGWRHQELLSRLLPTASKEAQDTLLEVVPSFAEGRVSLVEYISTLKEISGIQGLVAAIGIGKGKLDLTVNVSDSGRSNAHVSIRPEIPIGKACSSLSAKEVINFLTGGYRISKARSHDLFWEAVWPRLLAQGWHSEQPKDLKFLGSKFGIVFLVPSVKKYSRKSLVRGRDYFDSVSDVLNKVISDPSLLNLEIKGSNEKNNSEMNSLPDPRSKFGTLDMEFIIVDTSLAQDCKPFTARDLRSLPFQLISCGDPQSEEVNSETSEQPETADISLQIQSDYVHYLEDDEKQKNEFQSAGSDHLLFTSEREVLVNGVNCSDKSFDEPSQKQQKNNELSRRSRSLQIPQSTTVSKKRRSTACENLNHEHLSDSSCEAHEDKEQHFMQFDSLENNIMVSGVGSDVGSEHNTSENNDSGSRYDGSPIKVKMETRVLFDLNCLPEPDTSGFSCSDVVDIQASLNLNGPSSLLEGCDQPDVFQSSQVSNIDVTDTKVSNIDATDTQVSNTDATDTQVSNTDTANIHPSAGNSRRQSTRNRPLTMKALEALANGFLCPSPKRKWRGAVPSADAWTSRPCRRSRKESGSPGSSGDTNSNVAAATKSKTD